MRSGGFIHNYAERYVERFTATSCSEKLVTTHNVSLRIREDLGPSLLHASQAQVPTHNDIVKGDYSCKNLEMRTVCIRRGQFNNSNVGNTGIAQSFLHYSGNEQRD